ncbi:hypothetical protein [Vibrio vulnificus]|uniref:hypothetical protein n=1 Tax=Vibrio vulnificus TaxID=672 RepID=UPI003D9C86C1
MINQKYATSYIEGFGTESVFCELAQSKGFKVIPASKKENIEDHIDFYLYRDGKQYSVDVKAMKRISRNSINKDEDAIWIEFRNVRGNNGWIYGKQDLVAFEFDSYFVLVKRKELLDFVTVSLNSFTKVVSSSRHALFNLYQRRGRQDLITRIKRDNILALKNKIWIKNEGFNQIPEAVNAVH